jgi:hypothetical protein
MACRHKLPQFRRLHTDVLRLFASGRCELGALLTLSKLPPETERVTGCEAERGTGWAHGSQPQSTTAAVNSLSMTTCRWIPWRDLHTPSRITARCLRLNVDSYRRRLRSVGGSTAFCNRRRARLTCVADHPTERRCETDASVRLITSCGVCLSDGLSRSHEAGEHSV